VSPLGRGAYKSRGSTQVQASALPNPLLPEAAQFKELHSLAR
jgi:hypothetical protein